MVQREIDFEEKYGFPSEFDYDVIATTEVERSAEPEVDPYWKTVEIRGIEDEEVIHITTNEG